MYSSILKNGTKLLVRKVKQSAIKSSMRTDKNVDDFAEDWLDIGSLNNGKMIG